MLEKLKKKILIFLFTVFVSIFLLMGIVGAVSAAIIAVIGGEEEENKNNNIAIGTYQIISEEVESYREAILEEAKKYGKEDYIDLFLAIVMQESGGKVEDIFQCSESLGKEPNSITTQESIAQGVKVFSGLLDKAKVESPEDIEHIKVALQAYNYGSGYIDYITRTNYTNDYGKWTQENALEYQKKKSAIAGSPVPRTGEAAKNLGPYAYGDAYYTQHVLRYYAPACGTGSVTGSAEVGECAEVDEADRLKWLFPSGVPTSANEMQQYLIQITVPIVPYEGQTTMILTVHKKLANEILAVFEELRDLGFKVRPSDTAGYNWREMNGSSAGNISHHSYGCVIDLNWNSNGQYGAGYAPGEDEYSVTADVVNIWKEHGFYWGGDWDEAWFDPMHFTYTNH